MEVSGIILAGGKSSRMGKDKGLLEFKGKKLVEYQIELIRPFCNQLIISTNQDGYSDFGFQVVVDNYTDCGPIGGIEAALRKSESDWNIIVSCDTPFLRKELFDLMLEYKDNFDAVIPIHQRGVEPLAGLYHKSLVDFFAKKIEASDYKLQKIIKECRLRLFQASNLVDKYPDIFYNINSPKDLNFDSEL